MKKVGKKLGLERTTIGVLTPASLRRARGGDSYYTDGGYIPEDPMLDPPPPPPPPTTDPGSGNTNVGISVNIC